MPQTSENTDLAGKAARVRAMFDRIAGAYSLVNTLVSFGRDKHWRREAVRLAKVRHGDELLDVCCGPGELADAFAAARPAPARITACDFSEGMLDAARRRQRRRARPIQLVLADAADLPFSDASFDIVSCGFGLRNLADAAAGLAEFHRVLRPGGRLVLLEFAMPPARLPRAIYRLYFLHVLPAVAGLVSGDWQAYRYLPRSVLSFPDRAGIVASLRQAGFTVVDVFPLTRGIVSVYRARK